MLLACMSRKTSSTWKRARSHGACVICCGHEVISGRANSAHLKPELRRGAALLLASDCRLAVRWVPSERSPSDPLSRGKL
eukprot:8558912-Heterocapsa_arctica.AAC.1